MRCTFGAHLTPIHTETPAAIDIWQDGYVWISYVALLRADLEQSSIKVLNLTHQMFYRNTVALTKCRIIDNIILRQQRNMAILTVEEILNQ